MSKRSKIMTFVEASQKMEIGDIFKTEHDHWGDFELDVDEDDILFFKSYPVKKITLSPYHFILTGRIVYKESE